MEVGGPKTSGIIAIIFSSKGVSGRLSVRELLVRESAGSKDMSPYPGDGTDGSIDTHDGNTGVFSDDDSVVESLFFIETFSPDSYHRRAIQL